MYHTLIFVGRLSKDPEMKFLPDGKPVTTFSVAVDDNKKTIWFRVSAWEKQAEACNNYLKKGSKVLVEGRLAADPATGGPRIWNKQDGTAGTSFEVTASTVRFLSDRQAPDAQDAQDEDVPF